MSREKLPDRRPGINYKFRWEGHALFLSAGYYEDGRIGEIFLSAGKLTSAMDVASKDLAIAISLALQHGCPVDVLAKCFLHKEDGNPEGIGAAVMQLIMRQGLDKIEPWAWEPKDR